MTDLIDEFPAMAVVHWPSGPVNACSRHAGELMALGRFMGTHIAVTKADDGAQCSNCINENKKA